MPDILAIVSKAVFDKDARGLLVGDVWRTDRYVSNNKNLSPLAEGGRLFLVTVRPPSEALWLVAVLDSPQHDGKAWVAAENKASATDIGYLKKRIRFTSNTGISAKAGALGMSLQTPRALTADDTQLLLDACGVKLGKSKATRTAAKAPAKAAKAPAKAAPKATEPSKPSKPPKAAKPPKDGAASGGWSDVESALEAQDYARAMKLLLNRWRKSPAPETAALIERVSTELPAATDFETALATPAATNLSGALAKLNDGVRFAVALERLVGCAELDRDPRVASALCAFIESPPFTAQSSRDFWNSLYDQLVNRHADPRSVTKLGPLIDGYLQIFGGTVMGNSMQKRLRAAVATLSDRFPEPVEGGAPTSLTSLLPDDKQPRKSSAANTEAGFLEAIYEEPDNDAPREVYADWLMEQGNPRGEFMSLQFRRARGDALSAAEDKREASLLKKHLRDWLGPHYDATLKGTQVFEKGFMAACNLRLLGGKLGPVTNHPAWATVHTIKLVLGGTNEHGATLLKQPAMRHLRTLLDAPYDVVRALGEEATEHRLEHLEIGWMQYNEEKFVNSDWDPLLTAKTLRHLRTLGLALDHSRPESLESFWGSPRAKQLERLILRPRYGFSPGVIDEIRRQAPAKLAVRMHDGTFQLDLKRSGPLALSYAPTRKDAERMRSHQFERLLEALPRSLDGELSVTRLAKPELAKLEQQLPNASIDARE